MTYKAPQVSGSAMAMMAAVAAFMAVPLFIPGAPVVGQGGAIAASPEAGAPLAAFSAQQRAGIEKIVREYLLAHPEIIIEVSRELEKRQAVAQADSHAKLLVAKRAEIFRNPQDFVAGNPDGKVTVVEFSDYNCGWCKRSIGELQKLIDADKDVRVVIKEFPIFGEDSEFAARAAKASKTQGKYWEFHTAMMRERRVTKANVLQIAAKVGLDVEKLKTDMAKPEIAAALKETAAVAQALGIEGTPGLLVDSRVNVGYLPVSGLQDLISQVRKDGCKVC